MRRTFVIDCFPESVGRYRDGWALVLIDVIRATTTLLTALATGRRCIPVASHRAALQAARRLDNPLLVGELGGEMPPGFDLTNSPAAIAHRADTDRPMVLLSSSGTQLICASAGRPAAYVAALRNYGAVAQHLLANHERVALIGAGSRGSFREEDQLCCAWIGRRLLGAGYTPLDAATAAVTAYWQRRTVDSITDGASARFLQRTAQVRDLEFVLTHVDDLGLVARFDGAEVRPLAAEPALS